MPKTLERSPRGRTAIISYVPALHAGYKRLLDKYPEADVFVLDRSIIKQFDHLRKDLRSLEPEGAVAAITGWRRRAQTLAWDEIPQRVAQYATVIAPKDEVAEKLEGLVGGARLQLEDIFLRWDRRAMETARDLLDPDRNISTEPADQEIMRRIATEARKSTNIWRRVGAAIVRDGQVLAVASNQHQPLAHSNWTDGDPRSNAHRGASIDLSTDMHAEAYLIAHAAKTGMVMAGCDIYITTFPCPTCAKLIAQAGFTTCFYAVGYAMLDGKEVLRTAGVRLIQVEGVSVDDPNSNVWEAYPPAAKR